jgi:hypothetical protein
MDGQAAKRLADLKAAAPKKKQKTEPFAKMPLWFAKAAADATDTPKMLVIVETLHQRFKTGRNTFPLRGTRLKKWGVGRWTKYRTLSELEAAGLIKVDRQRGKTPIITLLV